MDRIDEAIKRLTDALVSIGMPVAYQEGIKDEIHRVCFDWADPKKTEIGFFTGLPREPYRGFFGTAKIQEIPVFLTEADCRAAITHAELQQEESETQGRKQSDGAPQSVGLGRNLIGAYGEIAVAKTLGLFWTGNIGGFKRYGDVGPYEVRATTYATGRLSVTPRDKDTAPYILVIVPSLDKEGWPKNTDAPVVATIKGWVWGREAKAKGEYRPAWADGADVYGVEQKDLDPISSLPTLDMMALLNPTDFTELEATLAELEETSKNDNGEEKPKKRRSIV